MGYPAGWLIKKAKILVIDEIRFICLSSLRRMRIILQQIVASCRGWEAVFLRAVKNHFLLS